MTAGLIPPSAPRHPKSLVAHGHTRDDDWFWLRERTNPATIAYIEAENTFTDATLASLDCLRATLFEEIRSHIQEDDESAPAPYGPWEYFTRTIEGSQYELHLRRPLTGGPATVVLDENAQATGHDFFAVGDIEISQDHQIVAWTRDTNGGERYSLHFCDIATGLALPDVIENCYYGIAWAQDCRTVFYCRPDDAMRPYQVWRHELGTRADADVLVYEDLDERFDMSLETSLSRAWILITSVSRITTEVWVIDASDPTELPRCIEPRRDGIEYYIIHHDHDVTGDRFLILNNANGATNFALHSAPVSNPGIESWSEVVGHSDDARIVSVDAFKDHILLYERVNGLQRLRVLTILDNEIHEIQMTDEIFSVWPGANLNYNTTVIRYGYSSMIVPKTVFDYDIATRTASLVKQQPVPAYTASNYVTKREWAIAHDGVRVPISIVFRSDTHIDGRAPLYHYAYGSYEATVEPTFRVLALPLLDRGFVVAISHPRGGGEMGRDWWEHGRGLEKINTFLDFNACTRHLHANGYGNPQTTVARGASAGGLLMGAVMHLAPDLYAGIVAEVPFVDVISTLQDPSIPLTVNEWDEWGDPADAKIYNAMLDYSPYDNIDAEAKYPRCLVTAGLNDPRVQYWEPTKFVAKMRYVSPATDILLRTEMGAGHGGPSGRYDAWKDEAFVQSWIIETAGVVV